MFSTCLTLVVTLLFAALGDERKDVADFERRVQRYWDLRNQIDAAIPPIPTDNPTPKEIVSREDALGEYFIVGYSGKLRKGNIKASRIEGKGFDQDNAFLIAEISGDDMVFQVISRTGETVDGGSVRRVEKQ